MREFNPKFYIDVKFEFVYVVSGMIDGFCLVEYVNFAFGKAAGVIVASFGFWDDH